MMSVTLSKNAITSFCGDILPLHLGFDGEHHDRLSRADITWEVDSDCVAIRSFSGCADGCFNNGVLLILKKPGKATVTARLDGEQYACTVTVREPAHASSDDKLEFFIGDLHNHAETGGTSDGKRSLEHWKGALEALRMDFAAILDHRQVRHMYLPEWEDGLFICGTEPGTRILDSKAEVKGIHYNMIVPNPKALEDLLTEFPEYEFEGGSEGHFKYLL